MAANGTHRCSALRVDSSEEAETLRENAGLRRRLEGKINPEFDDVEAWACECVDQIFELCGEEGGHLNEDCTRQLLCEHEGVADEWKRVHCATTRQLASSAEEAEMTNAFFSSDEAWAQHERDVRWGARRSLKGGDTCN